MLQGGAANHYSAKRCLSLSLSILWQPADHPEVITIPETGYLKGAVLRAD